MSEQQRHALVFGASGQIGKRVCDNLLRAGWQVHAVSRAAQVGAPVGTLVISQTSAKK